MFDYHRFIVTIPDGFPLEAAGPVFCAGITMFSPLTRWGADKVMKIHIYKFHVHQCQAQIEI